MPSSPEAKAKTGKFKSRDEVLIELRERIVSGELSAGEHFTETSLAGLIGTSRTPVRHAIATLEKEGFFEKVGARRYSVRAYGLDEIYRAVDLRSTLEGYAARILAEKGPSTDLLLKLRGCLATGEEIFRNDMTAEKASAYSEMNRVFHKLIVDAAGVPLVANMLAQLRSVPFASVEPVAYSGHEARRAIEIIRYAHDQHHAIVDALENRQSGRVEALMREHGDPAKRCIEILCTSLEDLKIVAQPVTIKSELNRVE